MGISLGIICILPILMYVVNSYLQKKVRKGIPQSILFIAAVLVCISFLKMFRMGFVFFVPVMIIGIIALIGKTRRKKKRPL